MPAFIRRFAILSVCATLSLSVFAAPQYVVDGDGDAVSDEIDDCPYTRPGTQVDGKGCPLRRDDADVDGIADDEDSCPYSSAGATVDTKGCALDGDFDGVADGLDRCTHTGFAFVVNVSGCAAGESAQPILVLPSLASAPPAPRVQLSRTPASAPIVAMPAVVAKLNAQRPIAAMPTPAIQASVESPVLLLKFTPDSTRLSESDLVIINAYVKIFARRLASDPAARLLLRAYADRRETDVATLAVGRMALVRSALVSKGISVDRIRAENGMLDGEDSSSNRRVEVRISN